MKIRETILLISLALLCACGGPVAETETAAKPEPAVERTPDEEVAELERICTEAGPEIQARQAERSLYERLGGREGIRAIVVDMLGRHQANPVVSPYFEDVDTDRFVEQGVDFISVGTGGEGEYSGRDVAMVHADMKLTNAVFLEAGADLDAAMAAAGYGAEERQEMMCALVGLRGLVITG